MSTTTLMKEQLEVGWIWSTSTKISEACINGFQTADGRWAFKFIFKWMIGIWVVLFIFGTIMTAAFGAHSPGEALTGGLFSAFLIEMLLSPFIVGTLIIFGLKHIKARRGGFSSEKRW